ncbi:MULTISPECIES: hypothetical protein [unclassified Ruegeria]|uniref:hypothetical protein n=1 Tax=unclassified Ruegeria TaxID=2625375 RepID=UPI001487B5A8|nr:MULTISPECIES: hypothetical protein [unclassified Ruegeria]
MSRNRGVFIGQRKDRLGARLLMMLTCIRLAEDFDTDYRVNWFPKGSDAPELEKPSELFSEDWMKAQFLDSATFDALTQTALPIWSFLNDENPDRLLAHLAEGRSVLVEEGFEVLSFPWEDIEAIRPRYRAFIHQIGFTPELRAIMDQADAALSGKGVSAYHIRRGDILNGLPWKHTTWPAKIEPEELYEAHLDKHPGRPAIMFSDQPELIARFRERYPDLMQMSDIADLSQLSRAKRDFIELYTMSRADEVIAPYISAFSMAAARISGNQRKVFRDVLTEDEIDQATDRAIARVTYGPDGFLNRSEAAHIYAKILFNLYKIGEKDRAAEAFEIADRLLAVGSDNAFLPLLQSLNCFYLERWDEADEHVTQALSGSQLWPEDYAVALALRAALFGEQKKRWRAGQDFTRAFWAKPIRPDVLVFGSRLLYRDQLSLRLLPPADWSLQKVIRRPWFNYNAHVAQREVLKRLPCNFDLLLLDWADLSLDQKARRLTGDRPRLEMLQAGLQRMTDIPDDDPRVRSFASLLDVHLGQVSRGDAIDETKAIVAGQSENPLYHKRLSDLYEADGDYAQARLSMADALACDPENPFLVFAMGRLLERAGATELGENQIINAADLDESTAAIQGMAGQILLKRGKKNKARRYLRRAHELFPPYKRFANQLKRAER